MQQSLPGGADEAIDRYRRDWNTYRSLEPEDPIIKGDDEAPPPPTRKALPDTFKVNLVVEKMGLGSNITSSLTTTDPAGDSIGSAEAGVAADEDPRGTQSPHPDRDAPAPGTALNVPDSADATILKQFYSAGSRSAYLTQALPSPPADWMARAIDPTKYEQLGVLQGSKWLSLADHLNVNLVGSPMDLGQWLSLLSMIGPKHPAAAPAISNLYTVRQEGSWMTVKPPDDGSDWLIDRFAFRDMIRSALDQDGLSIETAATYLATMDRDRAFLLWDQPFIEMLLRQDGRGGAGGLLYETEGLRFYATLSPEQRQFLHRQPLYFKNASSATLDWLRQDAFGAKDRDEPGESTEPTELLPEGLLPSGAIRILDETEQTVVTAVTPEGGPVGSLSSALTANVLGSSLAGSSGSAQEQSRAAWARAARRFRVGKRHSFTVEIQYCPGYKTTLTLSETLYAPRAFATFDELPDEFRQKVSESRAKRETLLKRRKAEAPPDRELPPPPQS